jgi:hypothetical protein
MAVERTAHPLSGANLAHQRLDHPPIRLQARTAFAIQMLKAADVPVQPREPKLGETVGHRSEYDIGALDVAPGERGEVRAQGHAGPHAYEASCSAHPRRPFWGLSLEL